MHKKDNLEEDELIEKNSNSSSETS